MSYTHEIKLTLNDYQGVIYKMIQLKIISSNGLFVNGALPYVLRVDDGINQASGFYFQISGNRKELIYYFTTDAFSGFSSSSEIVFGYAINSEENIINGVDVTSIDPLPIELSIIPHVDANNAWLSGL